MKAHRISTQVFGLIFLVSPLGAAQAAVSAKDKNVLKPIKIMLNYSLRKQDDKALKYIHLDAMSQYLLGEHFAKATSDQKTRFAYLLGENIKYRGFPLIVKYFKSVDVPLDTPKYQKDQKAVVHSTIIWSGSERTQFDWVMIPEKGSKYKVFDVLNAKGESSMEKNKVRVQKMIEKEGIEGMLKRFEKQVEKLKQG